MSLLFFWNSAKVNMGRSLAKGDNNYSTTIVFELPDLWHHYDTHSLVVNGCVFCGSLNLQLTIRSHAKGDKFNPSCYYCTVYLSIGAYVYLTKPHFCESPHAYKSLLKATEVITKLLFGIFSFVTVPFKSNTSKSSQ